MSDLIKRLNSFIEYAQATKKFADVRFYMDVKQEIERQQAEIARQHKEIIDNTGEFNKTIAMWFERVKEQQAEIKRLIKDCTIRRNELTGEPHSEREVLALNYIIDRLQAINPEKQ